MAVARELIELLKRAVDDRSGRVAHVKRFQESVWASEDLHPDPEVARMIRDLAYDLDFFEPDEGVRATDPALYGDERLEEEIHVVLRKLES